MTPPAHGEVGRVAVLLGFAGLLPQAAAVAGLIALRGFAEVGMIVAAAVIYPLAILSFLGGIWWGLAMRLERGQGTLAAVSVVPSLVAVLLAGVLAATGQVAWTLVAIGSAIALTLLADRALVARGVAPGGWMRLRVPLSIGLAALTILAGAMIGAPVVRY